MPKKADFAARAALRGVDDLSTPWDKALRRAERSAGRRFGRIERIGLRASRTLRRAMRKSLDPIGAAGGALRRGGRALGVFTKALGVGGAVGALAVDRYGKYEVAVDRLGNVIDGAIDPVAEYGATLKRTAVAFAIDPIETATGAYMAFSGGVEGTKDALMEFLPVAAKASKAGRTELATAVDALTSIRNVYGDLGTAEISDRLFVTEALGKTDFGKIAASIGDIVAQGDAAGLTLDEMLGPMASITKTGVETSAAFTQLSSMISGLQEPTPKAEKALKKLGISFGPGFVKNAGGMVNVIRQIRDAVEEFGAGEVLTKKVFGRKEGMKAATRLATSGFADLVEIVDALGESSGTTDERFGALQRRTGFRIEQLKVGAKALFGELGGGLAEGLGIDRLEDVPGAVGRASVAVRSASKSFAEGFTRALVPGGKLAALDFDSMAKEGGKALGTIVSALGKFVVWAGHAINKAGKLVEGVEAFADAAIKLGVVDDPGVAQRGRFVDRDELDPWGLSRGYIPEQLRRPGDELPAGVREIGRGAMTAELARRTTAPDLGGFRAAPSGGGAARIAGLVNKLGPRGAGEAAGVDVGGEIVVTVNVPSGVDAHVATKSKTRKVPLRASVGKRAEGL